jgi:hypothetical protein
MTRAFKTGVSIDGAVTAASTLGVTGDLSVNTNKFNVTASSGNTSIAGTLSVAQTNGINLNAIGGGGLRGTTTDNYLWTTNNVELTSWYGIGFVNLSTTGPVPQNEAGAIINVRSGEVAARNSLYTGGTLTAIGTLSTQGHKIFIQSTTPSSPAAGDVWIWY